ncbi:MAG: 4Fe-4S dicluster domain-containing protein [Desulfobacter sp.]|nr:MAG: 4Fe-4S dicluster domain-containing protein [Desulfobacter sp.]
MEKSDLTAYEKKCIQEEPAFCTARCPFHVDVKGFLAQMAGGNADKAFKIIEKTLPLPEIITRICDHPCEAACIRKELDDPLAIGRLERACAGNRNRQKKYFPPPAKETLVGIWGSGLSSLTAAWDLALKGYKVRVFEHEERLGGHLRQLDRAVLPPSVLDREIARLERFGVKFTTRAGYTSFLEAQDRFQAQYIGMDARGGPENPPETEEFSLQWLSDSKRFAGGFSRNGASASPDSYPIDLAFQGRKAATSMDRILSGVSLRAGREREGVFQTGLSTDISHEAIRPMIADAGKNIEQAALEAGRCIQCDCSRCIRTCNTFLENFKGHPGKYAREIYNNLAIVMGEKKANTLINSCSLCGQCETVCPNDFSMADLCLSARQEMVADNKMPPSAHEFALGEMAHANGETCFFSIHAPGKTTSDRVFFPGCQLTGSSPDQVKAAWAWLNNTLEEDIGLISGCCGAPAYWAGQKGLFQETGSRLKALWESWGRPGIITACTACTRMLEEVLPGAEISSLYVEMDALRAGLPRPQPSPAGPVAVSDPCTARRDTAVQQAVRSLALSQGLEIKELDTAGELTECCGFGGLVFNANPNLAGTIIQNRVRQSPLDYMAYCAMCRDRLARAGKPARHILDLFWPGTADPENRQDPGFSGRRRNLAAFKREMEGGEAPEDTVPITNGGKRIMIPPEALARMEDEFILVPDIQRVLDHHESEKNRSFFVDGERGAEIANFRPANVCFWVAFKEDGGAYEILDTWCHRMEVARPPGTAPGGPLDGHNPALSCGTCRTPLESVKNHVAYLDSRFDVDLPQCPGCGAVYISPEMARGKMAEVEKILEDK